MQSIFQITLLVPDYDEALSFYVGQLGFELIEDTRINDQIRWVVVGVGNGCALLLAKPDNQSEAALIGNQTASRIGFFLGTNDILRDYEAYTEVGVSFIQEPIKHDHGSVAIFEDPFGNRWDLIEHPNGHHFKLTSSIE